MILGILIVLLGLIAITVIIEYFPMTSEAILVWGHDALAFRETGKFFGEETHVSVPPPYIHYGKIVLKRSSYEYRFGRLDIIYLDKYYDAEEWHNMRASVLATADEYIEIGDSVRIHNGRATVVRPVNVKSTYVESTPYEGSTCEESEDQNH